VIEVLRVGGLTTVQDLGRPGLAALGVGRSGAADRGSLRLANRLVGNEEAAACLEVTLGGFRARVGSAAVVAVAGAPVAVRVGGREGHVHGPLEVPAGAELRLGVPPRGARTYLAVRGGLDVPPVLGSRSTDVLAGLGPPAVRPGDRLSVGSAVAGPPTVDVAPVPDLPDEVVLRALPGPRDDWFHPAALRTLGEAAYEVTPDSNRVGLRLAGPPLERAVTRELPPEGMPDGALQVPPSGQPVLFLADHPVTGGYPVLAVVPPDDLDLAAQARPGQRIRFRVGRPR
jgi:biotin-dependent carboxylase-like uncharacterized protein